MKNKLRMTPDQVQDRGGAGRSPTPSSYTDDVEFSPEDASRSDFDFMCEVLQIAVDSGATTLNIPDTVGYGIPEEYAERLQDIRARVRGDYVISTHCHDDLGLAVANSLAAVKAGARQVECTINGIGERAGNAAMEEIVMALRTRADYFGGIDTEHPRRGAGSRQSRSSAASPAIPCSTTRPSSAATPSRTRRASISTVC